MAATFAAEETTNLSDEIVWEVPDVLRKQIPTPESSPFHNPEQLLLQVSAFVEAAEEVDMDQDVHEDLMDTLELYKDHLSDLELVKGSANASDDDDAASDAEIVLDLSSLFVQSDDGMSAFHTLGSDNVVFSSLVLEWSKQDVQRMMRYLKEHGQSHLLLRWLNLMHSPGSGVEFFIEKYVITREIPIVKLLKAFRISLVSHLIAMSHGSNTMITASSAASEEYKDLVVFSARGDVSRVSHVLLCSYQIPDMRQQAPSQGQTTTIQHSPRRG
jgi:hypothetical protein